MGMITDPTLAEEMMRQIKAGQYPNRNTAYRLLMEIVNQFRDSIPSLANKAQEIIDTDYPDQKYSN